MPIINRMSHYEKRKKFLYNKRNTLTHTKINNNELIVTNQIFYFHTKFLHENRRTEDKKK